MEKEKSLCGPLILVPQIILINLQNCYGGVSQLQNLKQVFPWERFPFHFEEFSNAKCNS